jgi:hypothetical protein
MNSIHLARCRMRWRLFGLVSSRVRAERATFDWLREELEFASRTQLVAAPKKGLDLRAG